MHIDKRRMNCLHKLSATNYTKEIVLVRLVGPPRHPCRMRHEQPFLAKCDCECVGVEIVLANKKLKVIRSAVARDDGLLKMYRDKEKREKIKVLTDSLSNTPTDSYEAMFGNHVENALFSQ